MARVYGQHDSDIQLWIDERPNDFQQRVFDRLDGWPDPDVCWLWTMQLDYYGYGRVKIPRGLVDDQPVPVHRAVWVHRNGPAVGLVLDHDERGCVRRCANPDHLRLVPQRVNATENSESPLAVNSRKKACSKGHPLSEGNLRRLNRPGRECAECSRAKSREYRQTRMIAARLLGLTERQYLAVHGYRLATARGIIADTTITTTITSENHE